MLTLHPPQRGVTLIELVAGLAIVAFLLAAGAPSFTQWMQNAQVRTATEGLKAGLQLARAEAVRRNVQVRFQLTTSLDSGCAISTSGTSWVVNTARDTAGNAWNPAGLCQQTPSDTVAPGIIQKGSTGEDTYNVAVASKEVNSTGGAAGGPYNGCLTFNGWGRVTTPPAPNCTLGTGNYAQIDVSKPGIGPCLAAGGTMRCLRLIVSSSGEIRLCDPSLPAIDPGGCPW